MAKPSGERMLFPIVLLDEDLLSIDGVGWRRRWPSGGGRGGRRPPNVGCTKGCKRRGQERGRAEGNQPPSAAIGQHSEIGDEWTPRARVQVLGTNELERFYLVCISGPTRLVHMSQEEQNHNSGCLNLVRHERMSNE
jgi:hypothetical protein